MPSLSPSEAAIATLTVGGGAVSASVTVTVAVAALPSVASTGSLSWTLNVSALSAVLSAVMAMLIVFDASPGANCSVPVADV